MADQTNNSGSSGNTLLAVIVGALLVGIAFFFAFGGLPSGDQANDDGGTTVVDLPDVNITDNNGGGEGTN